MQRKGLEIDMYKPKLLFYYSNDLTKPSIGGAGFRLCRTIDLLKNYCDITVALPKQPLWEDLNVKYNSNIRDSDIKTVIIRHPKGIFRLRSCFGCYGPLDREIGKLAKNNDLCVSFTNFGHFGEPAIHFLIGLDIFNVVGIAGPKTKTWEPPFTSLKNAAISRFRKYAHLLMYIAKIICFRKKMFLKRCKDNGDRIISNSKWMASFFEREGLHLDVLYPPVTATFRDIPFNDRKSDFVCIGRIHEIKRIEVMIAMLKRLRDSGFWASDFHIIGEITKTPYAEYIHNLSKKYDWVKLEGKLVGKEKERLLTGCRYAIHGCSVEAFGISVVEYLKSGCIPFVPAGCGASEVVDVDDLCYKDEDDAVDKMICILGSDESKQNDLQRMLIKRGGKFSIDRFDRDVQCIFEEELSKRGFRGIFQNS